MSFEVPNTEPLRRGDLVLFRGQGFLFSVLGFLVGLFDSAWRKYSPKPWHCAVVVKTVENEPPLYYISEAWYPKVRERQFDPTTEKCTIYRWLDTEPSYTEVDRFLGITEGCSYDVMIYFITALTYLVRHLYNKTIPRLLDDRFSCWEYLADFTFFSGKPLQAFYDVPFITDILESLEVLPRRNVKVQPLQTYQKFYRQG